MNLSDLAAQMRAPRPRGYPMAVCVQCGTRRPVYPDGRCFSCARKGERAPIAKKAWKWTPEQVLAYASAMLRFRDLKTMNRVAAVSAAIGVPFYAVLYRSNGYKRRT
jgi:hypothetical protein